MLSQKTSLRGSITLANFSQHPPDGFVDQILFVGKETFRQFKCVIELIQFDEVTRGHNGDASLPKAF
jgi:hypothetical protein